MTPDPAQSSGPAQSSVAEAVPRVEPRPRATGWRAVTPNALTIARLVLTGGFVVILAWAGRDTDLGAAWLWLGAGLFVVAGVTDAADGYLARRWNAVSVFGRIVDPFADKILILSAFVMLADAGPRSPIAGWMAVVVLARELLVTTIRGVYEGRGVDFSAGTTGKIKMILQWAVLSLALIDLALARQGGGELEPRAWLYGLAVATVVFTAYSGWPYVRRAIEVERDRKRSAV